MLLLLLFLLLVVVVRRLRNSESGECELVPTGSSDCEEDAEDADCDSESGDAGASDDLEPWVDWIKRVTRRLDHHMCDLQIDSRIVAWRRNLWRFAARVATMTLDKWPQKVLEWNAAEDSRPVAGSMVDHINAGVTKSYLFCELVTFL